MRRFFRALREILESTGKDLNADLYGPKRCKTCHRPL